MLHVKIISRDSMLIFGKLLVQELTTKTMESSFDIVTILGWDIVVLYLVAIFIILVITPVIDYPSQVFQLYDVIFLNEICFISQ